MTEEKKYPQLSMNEFFFTYSFIFVLLLFIFVIIFFNDVPITNFEIFIDKYFKVSYWNIVKKNNYKYK